MTTEKRKGFQAYNLTDSGKKFTCYGDTPREAAGKLLAAMKAGRSRSKEMRINEGLHDGPFFTTVWGITAHGLSSEKRSWKLPANQTGLETLPDEQPAERV